MLLAFVENLRDRLVAQGLIGDDEFQRLTAAVKRHIDEPDTLVTGTIFFRAWGRRAVQLCTPRQLAEHYAANTGGAQLQAPSWFGATPE
jgi:hypothetical protein